jgi:hypothetical protein
MTPKVIAFTSNPSPAIHHINGNDRCGKLGDEKRLATTEQNNDVDIQIITKIAESLPHHHL